MSNYLSLPGVAGEYASVPDTNLFDADTAHLYQSAGVWAGVANTTAVTHEALDGATMGGKSLHCKSISAGSFGLSSAVTRLAVTPGTTYQYTIRLKVPAGLTINYQVWYYAAASGGAAIENGGYTEAVGTGDWQTVVREDTPSAGSNYVGTIAYVIATAADDTLAIDTACVRSGVDATFVPSLRIVGDLDMRAKAVAKAGAVSADATKTELGGVMTDQNAYLARFNTLSGDFIFSVWTDTSFRTLSAASAVVEDEVAEWRGTRLKASGATTIYKDGVSIATGTFDAGDALDPVGHLDGTHVGGWSARGFDGSAYWLEVRDGIDGPVVSRTDLTGLTAAELSAGELDTDEGHTVSLNGDEWAYVRPVTSGILAEAEAVWMADDGNDLYSPKWADRSGNDHHAQLGSAAGADTNDPEPLRFLGDKFMRTPGVAGNYASAENVNLFDADTAHVHQSKGYWQNGAGGVATLVADPDAYIGDNVVKVVATGSDTRVLYSLHGTGIITVTPGVQTTISLHGKATVAGRQFGINVQEFVGTTFDGGSTTGPQNALVVDEWVQGSVTFTPAAGVDNVRIRVYASKVATSGSLDANEVLYFDGGCHSQDADATFVPSRFVVGDVEHLFDGALDDWNGSSCYLWADNVSADFSGEGVLLIAGTCYYYYGDGSANNNETYTLPTLDAGSRHQFGVTRNPTTGAVLWYLDGVLVHTDSSTPAVLVSSESALAVGGHPVGTYPITGDVYSYERRDGIGGIPVTRFDAAYFDEPFDTADDPQGNEWTINRSGAGLYLVDQMAYGLHTDDYLEVADHADLDFADGEDATVVVVGRRHNDVTWGYFIGKRDGTVVGYCVANGPSGHDVNTVVYDSAAASSIATATGAADRTAATIAQRRDDTSPAHTAFVEGVAGTPETTATADLTNAADLYIGCYNASGNYFNGEIMAAAIFRRALTDDEILQAGKALAGPNKTDALDLHKQPLHTWIWANDLAAKGSKKALVGLLNELAGTTRLEYRKARRKYLGLD